MKRKLLMIEDDGQVCLVVRQFLKRKNWEFHSAATGTEGLEKASSVHPDVVLLDIQLPDMDGWDVCRKLKGGAALRAIPVVMISGTWTAEERARASTLGIARLHAKPVDLARLVRDVEELAR